VFYFKAMRNGAGLVYCDDAVTSLVAPRIRRASGPKLVAAMHGLDVILPIDWYQKRLRAAIKSLDKIICLSRATAAEVKRRGGREDQVEIIPGAVDENPTGFARDDTLYDKINGMLGIDLRSKKVLISVGRCVKRKGFDGFVKRVFHRLSDEYVYIIVSPEPRTPMWIKTLRPFLGRKLHHNLLLASGAYTMHSDLKRLSRDHERLFYLNGVSEEMRDLLFSAGDLFIMPNRTVEGDMEGFGLVALEAASRGLPVVATAIEGISDAVIEGRNGFCVEENDWQKMTYIIETMTSDRRELEQFKIRAREFTLANYSREKVFGRYAQLFDNLMSPFQSQL
jgi:phosphatidylinositol alpha-1,6-mannosyltransferase